MSIKKSQEVITNTSFMFFPYPLNVRSPVVYLGITKGHKTLFWCQQKLAGVG